MRIIGAEFVKSVSVVDTSQDVDLPEICFIGRSNVGKSSMINSLVMRRIARTSSTPGATRLINLFRVFCDVKGTRKKIVFSDFPGYGFSKVSKAVSQGWQAMIENYILNDKRIKSIVWLFDIRRDMDDLDRMLLEWLTINQLNVCFVLTKCDKEPQGVIARKKQLFSRYFKETPVIACSSKTGRGRSELIAYLELATQ